MSNGPWRRCPYTGVSLVKLQRSNAPLTDEGEFDVTELVRLRRLQYFLDCGALRLHDAPYFGDVILTNPDCPIHCHRVC